LYRIDVESHLTASAEVVWARVSTMAGVNDELMPVVRMTYPPEGESLDVSSMPIGEVAFRSWILLFGFLPIDRHALRLLRVEPGRGFLESSTSWNQRTWIHERTIESEPGGCRIADRVEFEPRLGLLGPLLQPIFRAVFRHRHARLRAHFGKIGD
jgi:ligand-binding SRPBCC domain-containing protein